MHVPIFFHRIQQVLCILSAKQRSLQEYYRKQCARLELKCKIIILDDTNNYLPYLDDCFDFLSGSTDNTAVLSAPSAPLRSLILCIAYVMRATNGRMSCQQAYEEIKDRHPSAYLTEEIMEQLNQYQKEVQLRYV